ncbi:hypothetical protein LSH36_350g03013 [Paralvinella palmiformis]|uniref:Uncharacterized protein n=1 Tax=Paralvinella palmiformis TaxID=53620 RepID=A0AAD9JFQ5_9ANNE|nr:hypothetical protein LSH36_350g03013 [Paralvinella palmiformis]
MPVTKLLTTTPNSSFHASPSPTSPSDIDKPSPQKRICIKLENGTKMFVSPGLAARLKHNSKHLDQDELVEPVSGDASLDDCGLFGFRYSEDEAADDVVMLNHGTKKPNPTEYGSSEKDGTWPRKKRGRLSSLRAALKPIFGRSSKSRTPEFGDCRQRDRVPLREAHSEESVLGPTTKKATPTKKKFSNQRKKLRTARCLSEPMLERVAESMTGEKSFSGGEDDLNLFYNRRPLDGVCLTTRVRCVRTDTATDVVVHRTAICNGGERYRVAIVDPHRQSDNNMPSSQCLLRTLDNGLMTGQGSLLPRCRLSTTKIVTILEPNGVNPDTSEIVRMPQSAGVGENSSDSQTVSSGKHLRPFGFGFDGDRCDYDDRMENSAAWTSNHGYIGSSPMPDDDVSGCRSPIGQECSGALVGGRQPAELSPTSSEESRLSIGHQHLFAKRKPHSVRGEKVLNSGVKKRLHSSKSDPTLLNPTEDNLLKATASSQNDLRNSTYDCYDNGNEADSSSSSEYDSSVMVSRDSGKVHRQCYNFTEDGLIIDDVDSPDEGRCIPNRLPEYLRLDVDDPVPSSSPEDGAEPLSGSPRNDTAWISHVFSDKVNQIKKGMSHVIG